MVASWLLRIFIRGPRGTSWGTQRRSLPWLFNMMASYWPQPPGPLILEPVKSACGIYKVAFARRFGLESFGKVLIFFFDCAALALLQSIQRGPVKIETRENVISCDITWLFIFAFFFKLTSYPITKWSNSDYCIPLE